MAVTREISSFHRDDEGHWVAELRCGHAQHVRHRPPFEIRPWVLDEAERTARIGSILDCPLCERGERPDGLVPFTSLGPYDETTVPPGLLKAHSIAVDRWAVLKVSEGAARLVFSDPLLDIELKSGEERVIPPLVAHHLVPTDHVQFTIELFDLVPTEHGQVNAKTLNAEPGADGEEHSLNVPAGRKMPVT